MPHEAMVIFSAILLASMSVGGLCAYGVYTTAVLNKRKLRTNPFYKLTLSLGIADCALLLITAIYAVPCIWTQSQVYGEGANPLVGWAVQLFWFPAPLTVGVIALNRYTAICHPKDVYEKIFGGKMVYCWIAACWIIGLSIGLPSFHPSFYLLFSPELFTWLYSDGAGAAFISKFELVLVTLVCVIAGICNFKVFKFIWENNRKVSPNKYSAQAAVRRKREMNLFIQFFLISLILLAFDLSLNVLPHIVDGPYAGLWIYFSYVLNCSINGYIYCALNTDIRNTIKGWLGIKAPLPQTTMAFTKGLGVLPGETQTRRVI